MGSALYLSQLLQKTLLLLTRKDCDRMAITSDASASPTHPPPPLAAPSNYNPVLENLGDEKTSKKHRNSCIASTYMEESRELSKSMAAQQLESNLSNGVTVFAHATAERPPARVGPNHIATSLQLGPSHNVRRESGLPQSLRSIPEPKVRRETVNRHPCNRARAPL